MQLAILGMGTALPGTALDEADSLRLAQALCSHTSEQMTWLKSMYRQLGIRSRHLAISEDVLDDALSGTHKSGLDLLSADGAAEHRGPSTARRMELYARHAGPLAVEASRQALAEADLRPRDITHLVTVSCTGFCNPGLDAEIIQQLALPITTERTHVGFMGCHGALNGLRVARALAAQPRARILLCAVELCSLHYYFGWDPQKWLANALFADGAAALVGAPAADDTAWRVAASGSCLFPDSTDAMTWTVGDHGFEMTLSRAVPRLIATHLRPWLAAWLDHNQLAIADVGCWAIHPGGPRILTAVEEALQLPPKATAASRQVFTEHGNMSSPTMLFVLKRLQQERARRPCVALGFGPGLTAEAALII
jgi:predicted naringenin-chalcone synthase